MANQKTTLRLKKSGLRVLNRNEQQQVAGGTGDNPLPFTQDLGDCLATDGCPTRIACGGGGGGGTVCCNPSMACNTWNGGCVPDTPDYPE